MKWPCLQPLDARQIGADVGQHVVDVLVGQVEPSQLTG
jgi:hypothetical protein